MNECIWVLIAFVIVVLLVLYINYLITLHGRVRRLEHKASPRLEIIEREVHGIGCYMRIIIGIAIFFCVCICVHYLCFCHPHIVSNGCPKPDALGTTIAIFGIVVTLLVGWQIYATIKAKDELTAVQKEIKDGYDKRIFEIEECCEKRKEELKQLNSDLGNMRKRLTEIDSEARDFANAVMHHSTGSEYLRDNIPTGAYSDFLEALRLLIKSGASKRNQDSLLLYQYVDSLSRTITKVRNENTEWAIRIFNSEKEFDKQEYDIQALLTIHECDDSIKENFAHIIGYRKDLIQEYGTCTEEDLLRAFQNRLNVINPDEDNENDTSTTESPDQPQAAEPARKEDETRNSTDSEE